MPTRSRVEGWTTGHLRSAALGWQRQASLVEQLYGQAQQSVGRAPWHGAASDQANTKLFENIVKIRGALHQLEQGEKIATRGADAIDGAKRDAIAAIEHAEHQFFSVSEDLTVTDRLPPIFGAPLALVRQLLTAQLQADIRSKALLLVQTDQNVADRLIGVSAALREFDLEGGKGGPSPGGEPTITGPAGPLKQDDDQADLNATLPGSDITISGDGRNGYPTLNGQKNPLEIEGNTPGNDAIRPLPTGTIVGPDAKQYALYSEVPYKLPNGQDNPEYATADTTVVDLADPSKAVGVLPGISQASGAYGPATSRMVIVGNTGPHPGDRTRMLYMSDPVDPANPNGWMTTLKPAGEIKGLAGDRESQLVSLKGGGFMLVGSDNFNPNVAGDQPISAITASTPEGLLTAQATPLFPPGAWPGGTAPYGPTVVDTVYDPVTGRETVQLRVSTWENPPGWDGTGVKPYNPKTYTTSVTVQQ
ncbi:MAG: hypothetical protein QOF31_1944 [Mycobacterium sp.]|nr:hypothetical protein [Mycobacterium sp.]